MRPSLKHKLRRATRETIREGVAAKGCADIRAPRAVDAWRDLLRTMPPGRSDDPGSHCPLAECHFNLRGQDFCWYLNLTMAETALGVLNTVIAYDRAHLLNDFA